MDSLYPSYEYCSGNPDGAMHIVDVYPFVSGRCCDSLDILYLATWEQIRGAGEYPENMICIGGGVDARAFFEEHGITGLICAEGSDPFAVLREVQEIFTKYYKLERVLLDTLLANAPIRAVLNACAQFLECHMILYGTDFSLLDYSDKFPPGDDDVLWKETLSARRSTMPMIPREKVKMLPSNSKDFPRSTYLDLGGGVNRHLNIAFDYGDSRIATLIFWEVVKPIDQNHQWLADYIADLIHPVIMERYNTNFGMRNYFRSSVVSALRYANTDSTFLLANLTRFGWNAHDDYQILLVALPHENSKISHYLYNYENLFADAYSDMIALRHADYILILLHNTACSILDQCLPALVKQLTMDDGLCGVGQKFCDFTQLKLQYDLAVLPLRTSLNTSRVRYFREIMDTHLINELSSCTALHALCHHAAVRVHEYDLANETDFLLTLETYLMNNKSLMAASDKLFIHRSTLSYRLKCIEKIVAMQLDDAHERLHILLSCIALRILSSKAPPPVIT